MKSSLQRLVESAKSDDGKLKQIQNKLDELKTQVLPDLSPDVQKLLQKLIDIPQHIIAQQFILQSLAFNTMRSRFENIDEAYSKSFEWIFADHSATAAESIESPHKVSFVEWLRDGNGIFHIAGKLGSGKSTLMKFLCENKSTKKVLNDWAKSKKLVVATFFFWRAGEENQKSLGGLRRSILFDTLGQRPDLIPALFPQQWEKVLSIDWRLPEKIYLSKGEIKGAFERLVQSPQLYQNHRFCFFIDGLDEYEETRAEDYIDMVNQLIDMTKIAPSDLKLCVSSRESPVFNKAFSDDKRFRLQDLTKNDIESLARGRLEDFLISNNGEVTAQNNEVLVNEIVQRAEGIFLWATLVISSLREGLYADNDLPSLLERVEDMPQDIEPLFQHLLYSIKRPDRKAAYQALAVVRKLQEFDCPSMSLFRYTFLKDLKQNSNFAMEAEFKDVESGRIELSSRLQKASGRLYSQCKGLLEIRQDDRMWSNKFGGGSVVFVHRSIFDWVTGQAIQNDMEEYCKDFDIVEGICQSLLAELKFSGRAIQNDMEEYLMSDSNFRNLVDEVHCVLRLRILSLTDIPPFSFLDTFQEACLHIQGRSRHDLAKYLIGIHHLKYWSRKNFLVSVLHQAAEQGHVEYVLWATSQDPLLTSDEKIFGGLFSLLISHFDNDGNVEVLQLLVSCLKNGASLNPDVNHPSRQYIRDARHTIWVNTILSGIGQLQQQQPATRKIFGEILEFMLKAGAKSDYSFGMDSYDTLCILEFISSYNTVSTVCDETTTKFVETKTRTLGDFVDFWQLDNATELKALMDRNVASNGKRTQNT